MHRDWYRRDVNGKNSELSPTVYGMKRERGGRYRGLTVRAAPHGPSLSATMLVVILSGDIINRVEALHVLSISLSLYFSLSLSLRFFQADLQDRVSAKFTELASSGSTSLY